jgi:hypothetical protein
VFSSLIFPFQMFPYKNRFSLLSIRSISFSTARSQIVTVYVNSKEYNVKLECNWTKVNFWASRFLEKSCVNISKDDKIEKIEDAAEQTTGIRKSIIRTNRQPMWCAFLHWKFFHSSWSLAHRIILNIDIGKFFTGILIHHHLHHHLNNLEMNKYFLRISGVDDERVSKNVL